MSEFTDRLRGLFRRPADRPPVVAVLRLHGVIGNLGPVRAGMNLAALAATIERAFRTKGAKAVALTINSPGGSPVQSELIMRRIRDLAAEKKLPVYAFAEDVAASGGYMLALAADEICALEASIVGSIGVVSSGFGFADLIEKLGVERRIHTAGENKVMLDPFRPENPDDIARLERMQEEIHRHFVGLVRERRGERLKEGDEALFNGDIWIGSEARELGLIDDISDLRTHMREKFGDKVKLRVVSPPRGLLRRLRSGSGATTPPLAEEQVRLWTHGVVDALEERAIWARLGL